MKHPIQSNRNVKRKWQVTNKIAIILMVCLGLINCSQSDVAADDLTVELRSDSNCSSLGESGCEQLDPFVFEYLLPSPNPSGCIGRISLFVSLCQTDGTIEYRFEEDLNGLIVLSQTGGPCLISPDEVERAYDLAVEFYMTEFDLTAKDDDCADDSGTTVSSLQFRVMCQRLCTTQVVDLVDDQWVTTTQLTYEPCLEVSGCCTTSRVWCYDRDIDDFIVSDPVTSVIADCSGNSVESNCQLLQAPVIGGQTQEDQCRARCD